MKNKEKDLQVEAYNENNPPTNEQVVEEQIQAKEEVESVTDHDEVDANDTAADKEFLETSAEAVGYENRESQWNTYRVMASYLDPEYSILDFGCARGDFEKFYQSEFEDSLDYTGIDMNQQLIDAGKKVYNEEVDLLCTNWFNLEKDLKKDWSINIGSNNLRYDTDVVKDDILYLYDTIRTMMEHSEKGSIILLASDQSDIDDGLISYNAGDIFNWAQKEFGMAAMDHSFSKDLFTLIIYKN